MSKIYPHKKIIAVLPAYNAAHTLERTVHDIPFDWIDEIILVDDASQDKTVEVACGLGLNVFTHSRNQGYGANQKTCYLKALNLGADIVIMIHPDHQYDPRLVPDLLIPLIREEADAVFGSRMMRPGSALDGGMPWWKYLANIFLTKLENIILRLRLSEYHSGFRAYTRKVLEILPLEHNSDNFVFDTEIIIQHKLAGFRILEIPISTRYFKEASIIGFKASVVYGLSILRSLGQYLLHKGGLKKYPKYTI